MERDTYCVARGRTLNLTDISKTTLQQQQSLSQIFGVGYMNLFGHSVVKGSETNKIYFLFY